MDDKNSLKKKSAALALAVSMVVANPLVLTGCNDHNNIQAQNQNNEENNEEEHHSAASSPFIFHSSSSSSSVKKGDDSSSGWHSWTTPNSSGDYSGVHSTSVVG